MMMTDKSFEKTELPAEKAARLIELRAEGASLDKIAKELKMSKTTVSRQISKNLKEINNRKYEIIDSLLEKYRFTKNAQLETYLSNYEIALNELRNRNFADMKSKDIIEYLKTIEEKFEKEKKDIQYITGETYEIDYTKDNTFPIEQVYDKIQLE